MAGNANSGRRPITQEQKDWILRKLDPLMRGGLSLHKACNSSGIPKSNVYNISRSDPIFLENLERFKQHTSVLVCRAIMNELHFIAAKQQRWIERDSLGLETTEDNFLTKDERKFIMWFADHSSSTIEEFSRFDSDRWDPREEIKRVGLMIDEASN